MKIPRWNRALVRKQGHSGFRPLRPKVTLDEAGDYKVDGSTGQVYTETTAPIQSTDDRDWARKTHHVGTTDPDLEGSTPQKSGEHLDISKNPGLRHGRGARSLEDSVIECILNNVSGITLSGMECLPYHLIQRIWDYSCNRCFLSLHAWVIFSKLLHQSEGATLDLLRYRHTIQSPRSPLEVYADPLISRSFDFITSLSITAAFPIPDLVRLSKITNLGALEIINIDPLDVKRPDPKSIAVSDRLVRAWHFAALNEGAFRVLRILRLWNYAELSNKSLVYLNSFPALALYDVCGCSFELSSKAEARSFGWKATIDENVLYLLESACVERAISMQASLGSKAKLPRRASACQLWDGSKTRKVTRSKVPSFANRPEALVVDETHGELARRQQIFDPVPDSSLPEESLPCHHMRYKGTGSSFGNNYPETWEFNTYTTFNRIGELRNDTDLSRAGISIGDKFLIQNELINPIPIVSLRLGETPHELLRTSVSRHKPLYNSLGSNRSSNSSLKYEMVSESGLWTAPSMAFIRIKVPTTETRPEGQSRGDAQQESKPSVKAAMPKPMKLHSINVKKSKKRNIDDMLNSFV